MRRILSLLLVLVLTLGTCALASCELFGETTTTTQKADEPKTLEFELIGNSSYAVAGIGTYSEVELIIPSEYKGKPVTSINDVAFLESRTIEKVLIPNSITSIGNRAFDLCTSLATVEFSGTVEEWKAIEKGEDIFKGCPVQTITCVDGQYCSHVFENWETIKEPTYEEAGLKRGTCTVCEEVEERVIPILKYQISVWVSTTWGVKELTAEHIARFMTNHPEYDAKYEVVIDAVGEGDAASRVLRNPSNAPDIYCFTQDSIPLLVANNLLSPPSEAGADEIKANNDFGSVNAATINDTLYAYPFSSDNGFFLFYDARYVSDEDAKTVEGIIAACQKSRKKFGFDFSSAWYAMAYFFAQPMGDNKPLCVSEWIFTPDGKNATGVNDTLNSDNGLIAMKGIQNLMSSGVWLNSSFDFGGTAAIVTGMWDVYTAQMAYGENMRAAKLPTYTVDGNTYQLGSYGGYKYMGIKPQEDAAKSEFLHALVSELTGEQAQLEKYVEFQIGPSNLKAQQSPEVVANEPLRALLEQNTYAQPQRYIPSDWWTDAAILTMSPKNATSDDDLKEALASYEKAINSYIK